MLLLQRLRPQIYRNVFLKIMRTQLASLRLKIQVFGFTAFDAFVVNALFKALTFELHASNLQLQLAQAKDDAYHHAKETMAGLTLATEFHVSNRSIHKAVAEIYENNVQMLWNISSLDQYTTPHREKKTISALAVDYQGKVYVCLNSGLLKVRSCHLFHPYATPLSLAIPLPTLHHCSPSPSLP